MKASVIYNATGASGPIHLGKDLEGKKGSGTLSPYTAREHPRNICMPLVLIEDGLPMHIATQRNQIISWLVRKVQPEKNCYVASSSVGALQQEKKKLKNVRHALKTCVSFNAI